MYHQKGLTILELLICLFILGVLAVIAVPALRSMLAAYRIENAAHAVNDALVLARSSALAQQKEVRLQVVEGEQWCVGITTASRCNCLQVGSCDLGRYASDAYAGVQLSAEGLDEGQVVFDRHRGTAIDGVQFVLSEQLMAMTIRLRPVGSTTFCSNTIGGYQRC